MAGDHTGDQLALTLQAHFQELVSVPQGAGTCAPYKASDLVQHPDAEVRLWACRCQLEILRIYAPSPPFEAQTLKLLLDEFVEQVSLLADCPSMMLHVPLVGLIERLVEVHALVLIFEYEEEVRDNFIISLTSTLLKASTLDKHDIAPPQELLSELLLGVLLECDDIPPRALSMIVNSCVEDAKGIRVCAGQSKFVSCTLLGLRSKPGALRFVQDCLMDIVGLAGTRGGGGAAPASPSKPSGKGFIEEEDEEKEEGGAEPGDDLDPHDLDPKQLGKLIRSFLELDPKFLLRALPQVQLHLRFQDSVWRVAMTELMGPLITSRKWATPLASSHPDLIHVFVERLEDLDDLVRIAAVKSACLVLQSVAENSTSKSENQSTSCCLPSPEEVSTVALASRLAVALDGRALDSSMSVRLRVVEGVADILQSDGGLDLMAASLPQVMRRVLDKRPLVREATLDLVGTTYREHVLPKIASRELDRVRQFAWMPQLVCEAFATFGLHGLGNTSQAEEVLERCFLGCGESSFDEDTRALCFAFFCWPNLEQGPESHSFRGLTTLLTKKRQLNSSLLRYVRARLASGGPLMVSSSAHFHGPISSSSSLVTTTFPGVAQRPGQCPDDLEAIVSEAIRTIVQCGPSSEEFAVNKKADASDLQRSAQALLASLDGVRDRNLWVYLEEALSGYHIDRQSSTTRQTSMEELKIILNELGTSLRVHHLNFLAPVLRRALLSTWMLPQQASFLFKSFVQPSASKSAEALSPESDNDDNLLPRQALATVLKHLPKCLPQVCKSLVPTLVDHLAEPRRDVSEVSLSMLSTLSKMWRQEDLPSLHPLPSIEMDGQQFAQKLIQALISQSTDALADLRKVTKKAVRCTELLLAEGSRVDSLKHLETRCSEQLLVQDMSSSESGCLPLFLMGAIMATTTSKNGEEASGLAASTTSKWIQHATDIAKGALSSPHLLAAAAEVLAGTNSFEKIEELLRLLLLKQGSPEHSSGCLVAIADDTVSLEQAALAGDRSEHMSEVAVGMLFATSVRAMRSGHLAMTVPLLSRLAEVQPTLEGLTVLRKCLKIGRNDGVLKSLRLLSTLPCVCALSEDSKLREAAKQMLQAVFLATLRRQSTTEEALMDLSVSYFVHFLAHLRILEEEALGPDLTSYPKSSKVASFFFETLQKVSSKEVAQSLRCVAAIRACRDRTLPADLLESTSTASTSTSASANLSGTSTRATNDMLLKAVSVVRHCCEKLGATFDEASSSGRGASVLLPNDLFVPLDESLMLTAPGPSVSLQAGAGLPKQQALPSIMDHHHHDHDFGCLNNNGQSEGSPGLPHHRCDDDEEHTRDGLFEHVFGGYVGEGSGEGGEEAAAEGQRESGGGGDLEEARAAGAAAASPSTSSLLSKRRLSKQAAQHISPLHDASKRSSSDLSSSFSLAPTEKQGSGTDGLSSLFQSLASTKKRADSKNSSVGKSSKASAANIGVLGMTTPKSEAKRKSGSQEVASGSALTPNSSKDGEPANVQGTPVSNGQRTAGKTSASNQYTPQKRRGAKASLASLLAAASAAGEQPPTAPKKRQRRR
eukprot:CAMPEP_0206524098 /NCGR_PEP_ID=MMETSP0324_2-20121206/68000_1 /ASSEMBLY_ACC=CAM_ASM_000836 /TAXON_ID=2866 /ORGANISM="Crypthecodinium cohnii, Strain Seligo" /LENGTH=1559 /DNA_ID=CAMNT_0054018637 /DNA_START=19 /DNA_END=4698 /DNA_ORIENTATION=-